MTSYETPPPPPNPHAPPVPDRDSLVVFSKKDWEDMARSDFADPGDDAARKTMQVIGSESILRERQERMASVTTSSGAEYFFLFVRKSIKGHLAIDSGLARDETYLRVDGKGVIACFRNPVQRHAVEPGIMPAGTVVLDYFVKRKKLFTQYPRNRQLGIEQFRISSSVTGISTVSDIPGWASELLYRV